MAPNSPGIREDGLRELREIRLRRGLSQADLSTITGVAEFTISEIESGKRANPRPSTLRKLAQGLGVEVTALYGEIDSPLGETPPSQEKLFNNGEPASERHDHDFLNARNALDKLCGYWDERLASGDVTRREFEDLAAAINALVPVLMETLAAERNELLAAGKAGDVGSSVIWPALERFLALGDRLGKLEHDLHGADMDAEKRRSSLAVLEGIRRTA
jgi:transcriptional regulator with XRE-family HTH domain